LAVRETHKGINRNERYFDALASRATDLDAWRRHACRCSQLVYHKDGKLISIEGDPESHISRGRLCPKGSDSHELLTHADRETRMNIAVHTRREELDLEVTGGELRLLLRIEEKFQHFAENKIMKRIYC
jgi:Molybdopterin oxidoreductase Fe4S4 domain